ncbi:MAG TPA: PhoU domain-containing protein, partial [Anaerolineales bacterium]|nr:PhoU domain-containing protein [Anaerolineales bacterium]
MPRETLDRKIKDLLDELLIMDSMIEKCVMESIDALKRRDLKAAQRAYNYDDEINTKRYEIENAAITTIATQQPVMAGD